MTNEEAIKQIETIIENKILFENNNNDVKALKKAITALDLRMPKKPGNDPFLNNQYLCPQCYSLQSQKTDTIAYCPSCGQAIDWP